MRDMGPFSVSCNGTVSVSCNKLHKVAESKRKLCSLQLSGTGSIHSTTGSTIVAMHMHVHKLVACPLAEPLSKPHLLPQQRGHSQRATVQPSLAHCS